MSRTGMDALERHIREVCSVLLVVASPLGLVGRFEALALLWDEHIRSNIAEARALAAQRDAVLPGLVSGAVRVWVSSPIE